jgi:hypothetical protein
MARPAECGREWQKEKENAHMATHGARFTLPLCLVLALAAPPPARPDEPVQEDAAAIEALQGQGIDLAQPQMVEFMFSFAAAQPGRRLGKTLAQEGFRARLTRAGEQDVVLLARKRMLIDERTLAALRARFEAMAKAEQGQYEGWGIP